ncbi:MAG: hypothetical protein IJH76_02705 [Clostridia bacterium]|nr:hypothetical protein [Clostridia bacterium]
MLVKMKDNKGITLIALSITIVVIIIIASISINYGKKSIEVSKLETLKTNMLLIKAKAKEYVEQADFKAGVNNEYKDGDNLKAEVASELKGTPDTESYSFVTLEEGQYLYNITPELENIGLQNIKVDETKSEKYLVVYDLKNTKVEVYNTIGFNDNGTTKYSLSDLEEIDY